MLTFRDKEENKGNIKINNSVLMNSGKVKNAIIT